MQLDCPNAEAISQVAVDCGWGHVASLRFDRASLAGLVELARTAFHAGRDAQECAELCIGNLPSAKLAYRTILAMLAGEFDPIRPQSHLFSAPTWELWLVRSSGCIESAEFSLFAKRFQRSLAQAGFGSRFPYALSQALIEMAENVVRHSAKEGKAPAIGIVGYHVTQEAMNYVIADLGMGVLRSLKGNRKWTMLSSEADALVAAAQNGATRLSSQTAGDGFRVAIQGFLDREGVLAMRSGDGTVRLHGNMDFREAEVGNVHSVPGLRVCGQCMLSGKFGEIDLTA